MTTWIWIWLIVAVLAAIGEAVTYDLFLASLSVAAVITTVLAVLLLPWALQIVFFATVSLVGIGFVRPAVKHALGIDSLAQPMGRIRHSHVVGHRAVVTHAIGADTGQIRIGQGEFWTARPYEPGECFAVGAEVEIVLVEGLTALVEPAGRDVSLDDDTLSPQLVKGN